MKKVREDIKKITNSFPEYRYDIETTMWEWIIYFWKSTESDNFFFELPNAVDPWEIERGGTGMITPKANISVRGEWHKFENENLDILIKNIKDILNGEKE